jgi:ubiquinone/menaquinone biosynthesis C-methylase UbiE
MDDGIIKNEIRSKYDNEVEKYDDIFKNKAGLHFIRRKIAKAISFNAINKNQNILEIGSATGVFSFEYEKLGVKLTSIDLSPKNIEYVNKKKLAQNSMIDFQVGDVENLQFLDNNFDGIISFSTLRYVPNIEKALNELFRVLKPNGYIIIDFPNKLCPWFGHLKKLILGREHIHDNHYFKRDIIRLMKEAGFKSIKIKRGLLIPKSTPDFVFPLFKVFEFFAEKIPFINVFSAIIFCYGKKK